MHNAVVRPLCMHNGVVRTTGVVRAMPSERHERERAKRASTGTGYFQVRTKSKGFGLRSARARSAQARGADQKPLLPSLSAVSAFHFTSMHNGVCAPVVHNGVVHSTRCARAPPPSSVTPELGHL